MAFGTALIWTHNWTQDVKISLTVLEVFLWLVLTLALLDQIVRPLQTLTNVVGALREEDYSFRARGAAPNDAMGELALEINALADILTEQRLQSIEATALLRRVVEEIDTPLFTFDPHHVLRLVNASGERLLQQPTARLLGKTATELELDACFEAPNETLVALPLLRAERTLDGAQALFPAEWRSAHADRAVRRKPRPARGRAQRLAEADPRAWTRAEQFAGADHLDRRQPVVALAACRSCRRRRMPTSSAD